MSNTPANLSGIESVLLAGDLGRLTSEQKIQYHNQVCELVGLNPLTKPFEYLNLQGKTVLYANKNCAEQLRKLHGISITACDHKQVGETLIVTVKAKDAAGREDVSTAAIQIGHLKGDALANAIMKAETKAKRRVTLSICSLGMLDESELDTIKNARREPMDITPKAEPPKMIEVVDKSTGEITEMPAMDDMNFGEDSNVIETKGFKMEVDWSQFRYKYHLPFKKAGKDMKAVRDWVKSQGWRWRPAKDKEGNLIPGGDDCWYTNDDSQKLSEYKHENTEHPDYKAPTMNEVLAGDDIPF